MTATYTGSRTEQGKPRAAAPASGTVQSVESALSTGELGIVGGGGGGGVEVTHGRRADESDQGPPAV